ncbi:MAG: DUF4037 domain-containing protein [Pyrinomonadaceae bacterium]|nr:DUF4037 domain-containing protein [Pyrinomonadaceae bacterium]
MPKFIQGLELSRLFFVEAVKPILDADFPSLKYAAALTGHGSEILGFDTEMSTDHYWGARLMIFLAEKDLAEFQNEINEVLKQKLPYKIHGHSTNFVLISKEDNSLIPLEIESGLVNHRVQMFTIRDFFRDYLNFDINQTIEPIDWLTFPEQKLRTIRAGAIYHDEIGLRETVQRFDYYPQDVWFYLLASGWNRIGQEEHLMGRAGMVGDEIGSALIASRLVRDLMRLCFLMEKEFAPYPKWFGTAFSHLKCAEYLTPIFKQVLSAQTWQDREKHLVKAYEFVAEMHNQLQITEPLTAKADDFFGRPFKVIHLHGNFAAAICRKISDSQVKSLIEKELIGSIDQISDNTDILSKPHWRPVLRKIYE